MGAGWYDLILDTLASAEYIRLSRRNSAAWLWLPRSCLPLDLQFKTPDPALTDGGDGTPAGYINRRGTERMEPWQEDRTRAKRGVESSIVSRSRKRKGSADSTRRTALRSPKRHQANGLLQMSPQSQGENLPKRIALANNGFAQVQGILKAWTRAWRNRFLGRPTNTRRNHQTLQPTEPATDGTSPQGEKFAVRAVITRPNAGQVKHPESPDARI